MSCTHDDTLLNDDEVVEVVSAATSLNGSELSGACPVQASAPIRGRWATESPPPGVEMVVEVPTRSKKKNKKLRNYAPIPPPPPPPLPLDRVLGIPSRERALFVGCLKCTDLIVVRYNHSPFTFFESVPHYYAMVVTTCRKCLKSGRSYPGETTRQVDERCQAGADALQLSIEFIQSSYIYRVVSAVVGTGSTVVPLERSCGAAAYLPISTLIEEMDSDCIVLGMTFNKPPEPPRADKIKVLSYLPGGFL